MYCTEPLDIARIVYQFLDRASEACEMQSASLAQHLFRINQHR